MGAAKSGSGGHGPASRARRNGGRRIQTGAAAVPCAKCYAAWGKLPPMPGKKEPGNATEILIVIGFSAMLGLWLLNKFFDYAEQKYVYPDRDNRANHPGKRRRGMRSKEKQY